MTRNCVSYLYGHQWCHNKPIVTKYKRIFKPFCIVKVTYMIIIIAGLSQVSLKGEVYQKIKNLNSFHNRKTTVHLWNTN